MDEKSKKDADDSSETVVEEKVVETGKSSRDCVS